MMEVQQEKITILCVDDEPNVLSALKRIFIDEDYTILTASSGPEGIELLEHERVQVVISDYRMPSMNGVEFLTEVFKLWPDTVRIVLSGYADSASIVAAINEGHIYKFIPKPWNDDELKVTIANSIERYFLLKANIELSDALMTKNEELLQLNQKLTRLLEDQTLNLTFREMALRSRQNVLDSIPIGILGFDENWTIATCNATCYRVLSREQDILGKSIFNIFPESLSLICERVFTERHISEYSEVEGRRYQVLVNILDASSGQRSATLTFLPAGDRA